LSDFDKFDEHHTNFRKNEKFNLSDIFDDEINTFKNEFNLKEIKPKHFWFEKCLKKEYHSPHTHGLIGYSAVCYVDYDENEHSPINFLSPFHNFLNGEPSLYVPSNVTEGTIIFFPSTLLHWVSPNNSEKERLVVSFNLKVN
jgi:uncharacterized protein (TIGR02466 family)